METNYEFSKGLMNGIRAALYKGSRFDAVKMSEGVYNQLVKELAPILIYHGETNDEPLYKETFMGLQVFVDYNAPFDYCQLGYSDYFETNKTTVYVLNAKED